MGLLFKISIKQSFVPPECEGQGLYKSMGLLCNLITTKTVTF
jgi:hypothetical protein